MKRWTTFTLFMLLAVGLSAREVVLTYKDFGPQSSAYELIGMEWWQWETHGDSRPREYPINVVVYWNQSLNQTKINYPVDRSNERDYRYIGYAPAIAYLEKTIKSMKEDGLNVFALEITLTRLLSEKNEPNQALQHNDPSCHVSCFRTPRASWGRG